MEIKFGIFSFYKKNCVTLSVYTSMCISVQMCTRYTFCVLSIIWIKTNLRYFCLKLIMLIDEISNTLKIKLPKFPPPKKISGHIKCFQMELFLMFLAVVYYMLLGLLRQSIRRY